MVQNISANPFKPSETPSAVSVTPQARLILQDPLAFDQATQPVLRSSVELSVEPSAAGIDREKARDLWESLSQEPEVAQERQSERKRLLLRAEAQAQESAAAKAQAIELQAQLSKARDDRFNHPLVYAGAASLLGLGALWLMERRKRMALQERELELLAEQTPSLMQDTHKDQSAKLPADEAVADVYAYLPQRGSTFSLEDSPDLADDFATDLPGLPVPKPLSEPSFERLPELLSQPVPQQSALVLNQQLKTAETKTKIAATTAPSTPDWAQVKSDDSREEYGVKDMPWHKSQSSLLSMPKRVLSKILGRRVPQVGSVTTSTSHLQTEIQSSLHHSTGASSTLIHEQMDDATQLLYDEEAQEAFEQELLSQQLGAGLHAGYNSDQANIELLSQMRVTPLGGESVMEHLLELRTAVNGLCALGRPEGAARLLEQHIAAEPGCCAWAYLEYMHLCEQIGQREDFETMRKNYRLQFNRMAPYWHEPNSNVLGLDGYARAAGELCAAWAQGIEHTHHTLASWLVGPLLGRKLVQLPAFHDLFDLYEMLEFIEIPTDLHNADSASGALLARASATGELLNLDSFRVPNSDVQAEQEFVPTVSLLDLDYEFSSDVTLEESEVQQSEKAVTTVKTGNFSVDFNVAGTQLGALPSVPAELAIK